MLDAAARPGALTSERRRRKDAIDQVIDLAR
jgi:hypothetical protein